MQCKRDGLVPIAEALADLPGPVKVKLSVVSLGDCHIVSGVPSVRLAPLQRQRQTHRPRLPPQSCRERLSYGDGKEKMVSDGLLTLSAGVPSQTGRHGRICL